MFLRTLIQFLFPSICVVCKKGSTRLHFPCAKKLPSAESSPHRWIFSLYRYRDRRVEKLIRYLKNKEDLELGETLGKLLATYLHDQQPTHFSRHTGALIVTPVPARKERLKSKGFNQAELLARNMVRYYPNSIYTTKLLHRTRETEKQALIHNKAHRLMNLQNIFALYTNKKDSIQNTTVLVIDDVSTSGATLCEIKKVLEDAGAREVFAITLAH